MIEERVDFDQFSWFNPPDKIETIPDGIELTTLPDTDFWQRTHYGFRRNNGHAFMTRLWDDFSFTVHTEFFYESLFDQCGIILYIDEDNWAKASIEYEDEAMGQLGSVVTTNGYSDWAVAPIPTDINRMSYRISRRGEDFKIEYSQEGDVFSQMRVFHVVANLSLAKIGIYACSPSNSSFKARFRDATVSPSIWKD